MQKARTNRPRLLDTSPNYNLFSIFEIVLAQNTAFHDIDALPCRGRAEELSARSLIDEPALFHDAGGADILRRMLAVDAEKSHFLKAIAQNFGKSLRHDALSPPSLAHAVTDRAAFLNIVRAHNGNVTDENISLFQNDRPMVDMRLAAVPTF